MVLPNCRGGALPLPKTANQATAFLGQGNALSLQYVVYFGPINDNLQSVKAQSGTGDTAVLRTDIHQNNIRANALDTAPGDHIVVAAV